MKYIYLSFMAGKPLIEYLERAGYMPVLLKGINSPVSEPVATHADLYMCQIGAAPGSKIFFGEPEALGAKYPDDVIYNGVCTSKYFIHNLKYTSDKLLSRISGRIPVNVSQGYTRCCCLPVDEESFITSDEGIAKALAAANAQVLRIREGYIKLKGFPYGFIGGSAGKIHAYGMDIMVFNGNLSAHPDFKKIVNFIEARNITLVFFTDYELEDIGSIIPG